jgi:hypothetical protein
MRRVESTGGVCGNANVDSTCLKRFGPPILYFITRDFYFLYSIPVKPAGLGSLSVLLMVRLLSTDRALPHTCLQTSSPFANGGNSCTPLWWLRFASWVQRGCIVARRMAWWLTLTIAHFDIVDSALFKTSTRNSLTGQESFVMHTRVKSRHYISSHRTGVFSCNSAQRTAENSSKQDPSNATALLQPTVPSFT